MDTHLYNNHKTRYSKDKVRGKGGQAQSRFLLFLQLAQSLSDEEINGLEVKKPLPKAVWNRIADRDREAVIELALNKPELSPRELAVRYTDEKGYFLSEPSVGRLLLVQDHLTSPAYSQ